MYQRYPRTKTVRRAARRWRWLNVVYWVCDLIGDNNTLWRPIQPLYDRAFRRWEEADAEVIREARDDHYVESITKGFGDGPSN